MNARIDLCSKVVKENGKLTIKNNGNKMIIINDNEEINSFSTLHYYLDELNRIVRFYDNKIIMNLN